MVDLNKIKIVCSLLTGELYIARFGKDPGIALDKRPVESELMIALTQHFMNGSPSGRELVYKIGEKRYKLTIGPFIKTVKLSKKQSDKFDSDKRKGL